MLYLLYKYDVSLPAWNFKYLVSSRSFSGVWTSLTCFHHLAAVVLLLYEQSLGLRAYYRIGISFSWNFLCRNVKADN